MTITLTDEAISAFRAGVWAHFEREGRAMPWRETRDPYRILVSEIMLQQTQVSRVIVKYAEFIAAFPDVRALASAPLDEVLRVWRGLGYNRRALMLKRAAEEVAARFGGGLPGDIAALRSLPGIGPYTAGAVLAFAFDRPTVIIETNIRTVFIHHFFPGGEEVRDADILPLIEATLDRADPRRWYWALMDYGSALKAAAGNAGRRSAHYTRQSAFHGSDRQIRGAVIRALLDSGETGGDELCKRLEIEPERFRRVIEGLERDGMLMRDGGRVRIG